MTTEESIRSRLRAWIVDRAERKHGHRVEHFDDRTPIIAAGLLSSLDVVELILFIEEIRGQEVDESQLEPETVESVDAIYKSLFT